MWKLTVQVRAQGGIRLKCIVLYFKNLPFVIVSQIDFLWFVTTNLFVAFITNFLVDQNVVSCAGSDLTFYFRHKPGSISRKKNLNEIINICTDE